METLNCKLLALKLNSLPTINPIFIQDYIASLHIKLKILFKDIPIEMQP
jgi:hypothetical protein